MTLEETMPHDLTPVAFGAAEALLAATPDAEADPVGRALALDAWSHHAPQEVWERGVLPRPVPDCQHADPMDGTCGHPDAATPECHPSVNCPELKHLLRRATGRR